MANMSYCRFENTASDLSDVEGHFDDCDLSESEQQARKRILRTCKRIADYTEEQIEDFVEDDEEAD